MNPGVKGVYINRLSTRTTTDMRNHIEHYIEHHIELHQHLRYINEPVSLWAHSARVVNRKLKRLPKWTQK